MKSKFLKNTLCLLAGFVLLAGCSKEEKEKTVTAAAEKSPEINFMIPDWGVPPQAMLDEFQKESGIKVNVETVAWDDIRSKIAIAANGKKAAADVYEVDWSWVGEFNAANWLEPLQLTAEDMADIPSISSFVVDEKVLAIPYANDFRIGYYNEKLYKEAGLEEPKTWDEVAKNMEILKEKNILKYPYTFPLNANEGTTTSFIWMTYLRDGKVFNEDNTLNRENALKTLTFINSMMDKGLINPANLSMSAIDTYRELLSGEAAFMVGPTSFIERSMDPAQSKVIGEIEVIVPPGADGKATQTMALTEAIGVSALSENKEAAKKFVQWYTSKNTQRAFFKEISAIPTRTSILNEVIDAGQIKNSGAMKETSVLVKSPFPNGVPAYYAEMSNAISNAVNKMASKQITPETAVDEIDSKIKELIQK